MKGLVILLALLAICNADTLKPVESVTSNKVVDFLKGFLEGLNDNGDINKLLDCIHDIDNLIDNIIEAFQLIKTKKADNIIKGLSLLITTVRDFLNKLQPCSEGFEQIKKLIAAFKNIDPLKLLFKILSNPTPYIESVVKAIEAFENGNFTEGGKRVGTFLYLVFIAQLGELDVQGVDVEAIFTVIIEFFHGLNKGNDANNLYECSKKFPEMYIEIVVMIEVLKEVKFNDINSVITGIMQIVSTIQSLTNALSPCIEVPTDIKNIVIILISTDLNVLMQKVMQNMFEIIRVLNEAANQIKEHKYAELGLGLGNLLYLIILKK